MWYMPCERKYKNLGEKAFGEQKYVTSQMLRQFCRNDAYLKREIERIEYLTPPAVRKRFGKIPVNKNESFGYSQSENGEIHFNSETDIIYYYDFNDMSGIDTDKTNAFLQSFVDGGTVIKQYSIPQSKTCKTEIKRNTTRNYSPWTIYETDANGNIIWENETLKIPKIKSDDMTCNEYWYIGFDRNRHYETRPNWLANMLNGEIPGITRGQTFKAKSTGVLKEIVLNLRGSTNTGMPLIVEIRRTEKVDGVWVPVDSDEPAIAYQEVKFTNTDPGVYSVVFDNPATIQEGVTYAIVLLSPLSHHTNCYWVGGWNKHCHADVYEDGNAFFSYNCGYTWIKYGKDTEESENIPYHTGKYAPQDFAFQCHIEVLKENCVSKYDVNKDYYVYLKPIYTNPVRSVSVSGTDKGDSMGDKYTLTYQVSQNGRDWINLEPNATHEFVDSGEGYKNVLFVRVKLRTTDAKETPILQNFAVHVRTELPKEMYVRTERYYPLTTGILGASVWGRLYAPFIERENTSCTVELISDNQSMEHFLIIEPKDLAGGDYKYITGIDWNKIVGKTETNIKKYLTDNPSVVNVLKTWNIYVKGYFKSIQLIKSPAYPLINMSLSPNNNSVAGKVYGEGYDYKVDYSTDEITFYNDVLNAMVKGDLVVTYNPVIIDGLSSSEVGIQYSKDTEGNLQVDGQGLILDYFQEEFVITEEDVENRRLKLKAIPVDPVRKVVIIKNTDDLDDEDNIILNEDIDYKVDYDNKEVEFLVNSEDNVSSVLEVGELIYIIYTPDLHESSIGIGYHAIRTQTNKDVTLLPNWIEYKV